jgi:hypothetical protein
MNNNYKNRLIEALNRLDQSAEMGNTEKEEAEQKEKDYNLLFNFIDERL